MPSERGIILSRFTCVPEDCYPTEEGVEEVKENSEKLQQPESKISICRRPFLSVPGEPRNVTREGIPSASKFSMLRAFMTTAPAENFWAGRDGR